MATSTITLIADNSTDAYFRAWGKGISDQIASFGWTRTADSANWSTVTHPTGNSQVSAYEMWTPGDGLTAFYLKIEYMNGNAGNAPRIRLSIGTGQDGGGNLTGLISSTNTGGSGGAGTGSTTYTCKFSGDTSRLDFLIWIGYGAATFVGVERFLDANGNPTSNGATLITCQNATLLQQSILFGTGVGVASTVPLCVGNTAVTSDSSAGNIPVSPVWPSVGGFQNPMTICGSARSADIGDGATFSCSMYGNTRIYYVSRTNNMTNFGPAGAANSSLLMRWD